MQQQFVVDEGDDPETAASKMEMQVREEEEERSLINRS